MFAREEQEKIFFCAEKNENAREIKLRNTKNRDMTSPYDFHKP